MGKDPRTQPPAQPVVAEPPLRRGPISLYQDKVRKPISVTLTLEHHAKVKKAMRRLALTRADLVGLLIDKYADTVVV